jgi:putative flippase GtrA
MTSLPTISDSQRKEGGRFIKFLMVGGIGFVVDAGTLFVFTSLLHFPDLIAQVFSFTAAIISNFTWNRFWTYPDSRTKRIRRQLVQFTLVNLAGLAIRTFIFASVLEPYRRLAARQTLISVAPADLARYASLATAVSVVLLWNFFVNRYWTYNDVG